MHTYHIEATPKFERKRLIQTKKVARWFYDVVRDDGEPEGRFSTPDEALAHLVHVRKQQTDS